MVGVLQRCFPEQYDSRWKIVFKQQIPALGEGVNGNAAAAAATLAETAEVLGLVPAAQPAVAA
jgi:malate dehydrogenase (quinone)